MDPTLTSHLPKAAPSDAESSLKPWLDSYARKERNDEELTYALADICSKAPQATWQALSLLDQYHRRRVLSTTLFRELKKQLTDIAFGSAGAHISADGRTMARDSTVHTQSLLTASLRTSRLRPPVLSTQAERTSTLLARNGDAHQASLDPPSNAAGHRGDDSTSLLADAGTPNADITEVLRGTPVVRNTETSNAEKTDWLTPETLEDRTAALPDPTRTLAPVNAIPAPPSIPLPASPAADAPTQVTSLTSQTPQRVGTVLSDRYMLIEPVVSGHISVLFRALDQKRMALPEAERYVAVKRPQETLQGDPRAVAAFQYEYTQAQAISHANIAKTFDFHSSSKLCYIVMELLQGESLDRLLERIAPRRLPTARALAIVREVGHALAHAHEHGVVHGNLQPSNITITPKGDLRVSDFAQSAGWLPADAPKPHAADDLYSLACIAHELLCGCPPDRNVGDTDKRPPYARHLTSQQWLTLQSVLAETNSERPDNVRRWLAGLDLRQAAIRLPPLEVLEKEIAGESRATKRVALIVASIAVALMLIAGIVALTMRLTRPEPTQAVDTRPSVNALSLPANTMWESSATPPASDSNSSTSPPQSGASNENSINNSIDTSAPSISGAVTGSATVDLPSVTFDADRYVIDATQSQAVLVIRRDPPFDRKLMLRYFTVADTAQPGVDYVGYQYVSLEIPPGQSRAEISIPLIKTAQRARPVSFDVRIGATAQALPGKAVVAKVVLPANTTR